jgi:hypothetical protein
LQAQLFAYKPRFHDLTFSSANRRNTITLQEPLSGFRRRHSLGREADLQLNLKFQHRLTVEWDTSD